MATLEDMSFVNSKEMMVSVSVSVSSPQSPQSPQSPSFLPLPEIKTSDITEADRQRATELMTAQRVLEKKDKKIKKSEPFGYKEANAVLTTIIADKANPPAPGLVQELLNHGANVSVARFKSTKILNKIIRKNQKEIRSDVLAQATQNCMLEVVWILNQQADETARNEALPFAIKQNDPAKAHILLASGADATPLCAEFLSTVDNGADDMVEVLLSAAKGPCQECRSQGLAKAAQNGATRNSLLLLDKGADADFKSGVALQGVIANGREDLAKAIASCAKPPSPSSFDLGVGVAYNKLGKDAGMQHLMIEICLGGGAKGSTTDEILVQACKNGQSDLIALLLAHNASVDHNSGAALQFAITSKQPSLLRTLLGGKPSNSTMATVIPHAAALDDLTIVHELIDILLTAGLRGDSVAETLIKVVEIGIKEGPNPGHLELIQLLLDKGEASVNLSSGKSIVLAAQQGQPSVLSLLLQHSPSVESLVTAFPHAMELVDSALRLEVVTMILVAGAKGTVVDEALIASAGAGEKSVALTSVILKQSSVDYDGGKPLVSAVKSRCLENIAALMVGNPSSSTLTAAWAEADAIEDDAFQLKAFEILLGGGVDASLKDKSLVAAVTRGQRGIPICTLLLQNQASPESMDGAAIVAAAKGLHLDILNLLAKSATSESVFVTAFVAFSDGTDWLSPRGLEVVHFLLEHGASCKEVDLAFCQAARLYEPDAVELLATSINPEVVNVALAFATNASKDWLAPKNLWLIHSLLEWGAEGECVNVAFLQAVDAYAQGAASEYLIDTFLSIGTKADVNFQSGEALQIAIRHGKATLLKKLVSNGAVEATISLAFAETITATHEEDVLLSLIDVLISNEGVKPDVKTPPNGYKPPIFACLAANPQSAKLVRRLLEIGCNLEAEIEDFLPYDDEELDAESVTPLAWALCQPEKRIGSATIEALIEGNANVNFTAKISGATPLILAAKYSRGDIVSKLIKIKANTSARDRFDRSALFYASRVGDLESVNALLKAKSPKNDGSLHEAAKRLHSDVVTALIKSKHSPDFPSSKEQHQGRTALQEMALRCDSSQDIIKIEETIKALLKGKAKVMEESGDKNALFLALDNINPVPITKALLDCVMWEHINKKENVYVAVEPETGTKYFFSPTMYVAKGFSQGLESDNDQLLALLRDKRCQDRYYAEQDAEQPEDAVGMPEEIIFAEKKRKDHEEKLRKRELEHQLKMLHEEEDAKQKAGIKQNEHDEKLLHEQELHEQRLMQETQKALQKQDIMASNTALKISLQQQTDAAKDRVTQARAAFEEQKKLRMAQIKAEGLEREQQLRLGFQEKANAQKLALKARQNRLVAVASERKLLVAKQMADVHAGEAKHKLAIKEKQQQLSLNLMKGTVKQKQALHSMQMQELHAKGQNLELNMLNKYFGGQQKNLKRITAG